MRAYTSKYPLPSAWESRSTSTRNQGALNNLKVDGLTVRYTGAQPWGERERASRR